MDTFKEQQQLDDMYSQGNAPWAVWKDSEKVAKSLNYTQNGRDANLVNLSF